MSILSRVQTNPEISTTFPNGSSNTNYLNELTAGVQQFVCDYCRFPRWPELSQGYSKSNTSAGTDLTALSSNELWIAVNGSDYYEVNPTLANCDSGANTATELQTQIRAVDSTKYGFDEVTVAYAGTQYTITSGRYGEDSTIHVTFSEDEKDVCQTLKLTTLYGGTEYPGMAANDRAEDAAVRIVEMLYARAGVEGFSSVSAPHGVSVAIESIPDIVLVQLNYMRRLWTGP